jgi:tetratricopeptide (TPR) repeat protein
MEEWLMAADLLSVLSIEEPKFSIETAEAYRSAGRYHQALQYNGFAPSSKEKAQQRFSLLLELEQFSSAVALTDRLVFWKLTEDDAVLYGLAYAYFQLRDFEKALQYCNGITDPTVFQQSVALRQIIRDCQASNGCW